MENASKALIIAGAILLSILIIALGIYVFNMAKGATNTNSLDELEVSQFNQPFTNYRGRQLGSGVIDLLDKVIANATTNKDADDRLPDIIYIDTDGSRRPSIGGSALDSDASAAITDLGAATDAFQIVSKSGETKTDIIGKLRSKIAEKHYYTVGFSNDDTTGLIKYIIIKY